MRGENQQPTIYTIAEKVGLSATTVSRALNGRPKVSEANRRKILRAAKDLGFVHPNRHAQALRTNRSHAIGLLAMDLINPYNMELARVIDLELRRHGYSHMIVGHDFSWSHPSNTSSMLVQSGVDAIISTVPVIEEDELRPRIPTIYISDRPEEGYDASLMIKIGSGTTEAVHRLVQLGHRYIAFLGVQKDDARARAYKQTMKKLGLKPLFWECNNIYSHRFELQGFVRRTLMEKLSEKSHRPSAVIAHDDLMALTVFQVAHEVGLSVPEDLSVVGHDDTYISQLATPPLTTVAIPFLKIGQRAAQLAIQLSGGTLSGNPSTASERNDKKQPQDGAGKDKNKNTSKHPIRDEFEVELVWRASASAAP